MVATEGAFAARDEGGRAAASGELSAEEAFASAAAFSGRLRAAAAEGGAILPGSTVLLAGGGLTAGQKLVFLRGTRRLNPEGSAVVDAEGGVSFAFKLPETAAVGRHQIVALAEAPTASTTLDLKISPNVPFSGEERFRIETKSLRPGLYQAARDAKTGALFVSSASFGGRGSGPSSALLKLDGRSLELLAEREAPRPAEPYLPAGPFKDAPMAIFGLGIDEARGRVWATNTIHGAVAVYDQGDLALVKQFPPEAIRHPREILVDGLRGRVYASGSASNEIGVFDAEALTQLETIRIVSAQRIETFTPMGLAADLARGRLYAVSRTTPEIAEIDLESGRVLRVFPAPGARNAAGLALDSARGRLLLACQDGDDLIALDAATGALIFQTPVGAGALSVAVDPASGRAYVANREADSLTVVGTEGEILANLDGGSHPNHVLSDGAGGVWLVNKARGPEDPRGDRVSRISPA